MALAQRPDPAPLETDDVRIVGGLSLVWVAALIMLLVLKATGAGIHGWWLLMCLEGAVLGAIGVRYCQRRRDAIARDRAPAPQ